MKSDRTWELDDENRIASGKSKVFFFFTPNHGVEHAGKHRILEEEKHDAIE